MLFKLAKSGIYWMYIFWGDHTHDCNFSDTYIWGFRSYSPLYINITVLNELSKLELISYNYIISWQIKTGNVIILHALLYGFAMKQLKVSTNLVLPWLFLWSLSHYIHNIEIPRINNHKNNSGFHFLMKLTVDRVWIIVVKFTLHCIYECRGKT